MHQDQWCLQGSSQLGFQPNAQIVTSALDSEINLRRFSGGLSKQEGLEEKEASGRGWIYFPEETLILSPHPPLGCRTQGQVRVCSSTNKEAEVEVSPLSSWYLCRDPLSWVSPHLPGASPFAWDWFLSGGGYC
jgi:hypothetical protein